MTPLATLGLFATILGAVFGPSEAGWNGYIEGDYRYLAPIAGGRITQLAADEGAQIAAGDLLVTLDSAQERAALEGAQAQIAMAEANLDNLQTGSRAPEIAVIRASIDAAEAEAHLAQTDLERTKALAARAVASQAQLEQQQARLDAARAKSAQLRAQLEVAELPARAAQRLAAEASLRAARAEGERAAIALREREIRAPLGGRIERIYFEPGEIAGAGTPVLSILPENALDLIFFVPQADRSALRLGQRLVLSCDGCTGVLAAEITHLADSPQYTPPILYSRAERERLVWRVKARLADGATLLPGQPVSVAKAAQ